MYISYGLGLGVIGAFAEVLWMVTHWSWNRLAFWAIVLFLPFVPIVTFLSRVLWIYLDQAIDPERK